MLNAKKNVPLGPDSSQPSLVGLGAARLARLGRQLLLVPEALALAGLLCAHCALGPSPLFALGAAAVTLYFAIRMTLLTLGRQAMSAANYDLATRLAYLAERLHPASADAHALRGAILLARGEAGRAAPALAHAVALFPLQADLQAALSAALLEDGRPHEARAAALAALALNPRSAAARLHLAGAEEHLGATPEQTEAHLRLGLALAAAPADQAALRCALAALLIAGGRVAEAERTLASAESLLGACPASQRAGLHFYLGELLNLSGDPARARGHFSASETLDPHGRYAAAAWRAARS